MKNITPFKVLDYVDGMVISESCIVRNMSMVRYHGQAVCTHPSISSSGARLIESRSLAHFYDQSDLNPNRAPDEPKHHFSWGKALHHLSAGEADFAKHFAVRPDSFDSWRTKESQKWRAEQQLDRKDVLVPDDLISLRIAAEKLAAHPTIQAGILHGLIEHSIFVKRDIVLPTGEVVTIFLKSRPDVIPVEADMIVDLKSCADASPAAVRRSIGEYGYYIQLALAHEAILETTGRTMEDHVLVFIESKRPCEINIKPLEPVAIEYGRRQLKRALVKFAGAVSSGKWPGYEDDEVPAGLPDWLAKRLAREAEDKLLPELDPPPPISSTPASDDVEEEAV